ncbi:type II toxin-antitoxin system VapC family toxin [Amycolatopsis pithecellobii]|uniref:Ribonuclease VapC n=1 Tax=Amycolatopsis pithecellobii TaxID=664692 RepID=A0A6N7Z1Y9_9PSEU|nr:type II toxin-antitoxin system VapC family toxin [Amycolatopsis pithecellobii]MTD53951.1 PIN domain-containing protein [Amycolatopsis pithecellobii]
MIEFVVDASAIIKAVSERTGEGAELASRLATVGVNAPHLVDAEVGDVLRRKVLHGQLRAETAATALRSLDSIVDARYAHVGALARDAWELRDRVRFYDALYVALAARLELPLLTVDVRLSKAPDLPCAVEVV